MGKLRKPIITEWMQNQNRAYDWAAVGKTAETAAWQQLVLAEGVNKEQDKPSTPAVAMVLLDLVKCFEKVKLIHVWTWGNYWKVPSALLKSILRVFAFQRTLIANGSHSRQMSTINAIVAGSAFSCAILHIVLLWPCDNLLRLFPTIRLAKYVDDISITVKGPRDLMADTAVLATRYLISALEGDLNMEVSKENAGTEGKSVVLTTHKGLENRMCSAMAAMGLRFESREKYLGIDCYGHGKRKGSYTKTKRMRLLRLRTRRMMALKKGGAEVRKVAVAGIKPSVLYGSKAMGLADGHIRALRRTISSSLAGAHIGRSTTLRLALHRADVQQACDAAPLVAWAAAIWDGTMDIAELEQAWFRQQIKVGIKKRWTAVSGPAGACIMTALRIGWSWPSCGTFVDPEGRLINLREICPQDVRAMALYDSEQALWERWTSQPQWASLAPKPCIDPFRRLCASTRAGFDIRRAVEHIVTMGSVTQMTLQSWGFADSGNCLRCECQGSAHHRFWTCPAHRNTRGQAERYYQHMGAEASPNNLLFTRGLEAEKKVPFHATPEVTHWQLEQGQEPMFENKIATDGSLMHKHSAGGKCGWAVVGNQNGQQMVAWGTMPASLPVQKRILRAELWAILQALRVCSPPIQIHTDCAAVIQGIKKGSKRCGNANAKHADVWRMIWHHIADIGLGENGIMIVKCKAHMTKKAMSTSTADQVEIAMMNAAADDWAKQGAEADHPIEWHVKALSEQHKKVESIVRYLAFV